MRLSNTEQIGFKLGRFFATISRDADELIGRTVFEATGDNFQDFLAKGKVPPLSLLFKAYGASTAHHLKKSFQGKSKANYAEILNPRNEVIGYTSYMRAPK